MALITIAAHTLPVPFTPGRVGEEIYLRVYCRQSFSRAGNAGIIQKNSVGEPGFYYSWPVSIVDNYLQVPEITLESTLDAHFRHEREASYAAGFYYIDGSLCQMWEPYSNFRLDSRPLNQTWGLIKQFNTHIAFFEPSEHYYDKQTVDRLLAQMIDPI